MKARQPLARRATGPRAMGVVGVALVTVALPVTAAGAAVPDPWVTYLTAGPPSQLLGAPGIFTGPPSGVGSTGLTPANLAVTTFAASQDGNTLVVGGQTVATTKDPLDETQGLVLETRDPSSTVTTARVLTTKWSGNPVLSADGATVWWVTDGKVWKHTGGLTSLVTSTVFAPLAGETVSGLAVSPDGANGAVVFTHPSHRTNAGPYAATRVLAASFAAGTSGPFFTASYADEVHSAMADPFAWVDDSTLVFGVRDNSTVYADPFQPLLYEMTGTLAQGGGGLPAYTGLTDYSDVRPLGSAWWMWMSPRLPGFNRYGTSADPTVAPTTLTDASAYSSGFMPSVVAPPALLVSPRIANRATARPVLLMATTTARSGDRVPYLSYNHYLTAVPGQTLADALYVDRGTLQASVDDATWVDVTKTTHSEPVPWPTSRYLSGSGYTAVLAQTTWLRWVYPGDWFTGPGTSAVTRVGVAPVVTATLSRTASGTRVTGRATRVGGRATLFRLVGGRLSTVAAVPISPSGTFSFSALPLVPGGSYRVITTPDASWDAGYAIFLA